MALTPLLSATESAVATESGATATTTATPLPAQIDDPVRTQEALEQMRSILRYRVFDGERCGEQMDLLVDSVGDGLELCNITIATRTQILYTTALLHLQQGLDGPRTRLYLQRLASAALDDLQQQILAAWQQFNAGAMDQGMDALRATNSALARAQLMKMFLRREDRAGIINWYLSLPHDDVDALTAESWYELSMTLAKSDMWEEAAELLARLFERHYNDCPDLLYLEGLVNLGLLLPPTLRSKILYSQLYGIRQMVTRHTASMYFRERALWALNQAEQQLSAAGAPARAEKARRLRAWLLLTGDDSYDQGVALVQDAMHEPQRAALYIELAAEFSIGVYTTVLQRFLNSRVLIAGFNSEEIAARYFFLKYSGNHAELIRFLQYEQEKLLRRVFYPGTWANFLIHELLAVDRLDRAEAVLYAQRDWLLDDYPVWQKHLAQLRGSPQAPATRFLQDESDATLVELCAHLHSQGDLQALKPFARKLYERQPSLPHAQLVAQCLAAGREDGQLLAFFAQHALNPRDDDTLRQHAAWSHYHQGQLRATQDLLAPAGGSSGRDSLLPLYTAFSGCDWSALAPQLQQLDSSTILPPDDLLTLALIAAPLDKSQAIAFISEAVDIAGDNPRILTQAYNLMANLDTRIPATPWLFRALAAHRLNGPLWQYGYNQIVDMVSNARECPALLWAQVMTAHLPAAVACQALHLPLAELLIGQALANEQAAQASEQRIIPLLHAHRGNRDIAAAGSIAMDFAAMLLAESLQLWPLLLQRFTTIYIPFSTAGVLREEELKLQYGHARRCDYAQRLQAAVDHGQVAAFIPVSVAPPRWLVTEVGETRAQLLHAAHLNEGKVIIPMPIYKAYSMASEEAELGHYDRYVVTTHHCLDVLTPDLPMERRRTAKSFLSDMDTDHIHGLTPGYRGPIYLDGLALQYLDQAGVLDDMLASGHNYFLHQTTLSYSQSMLTAASYHEDTQRLLQALRDRLQQGLRTDNIRLIPRLRNKYNTHTHAGCIVELLDGRTTADYYWMDDRSLNSRRADNEDRRQKRLINTSDILDELRLCGAISSERYFELRLLLRRRAYVVLPLEAEELRHWLAQSELAADGRRLQETDALRTLRHYLQHLKAHCILQVPAETYFMEQLHLAAMATLRDSWAQAAVAPALAQARASWLLEHMLPRLTHWRHALEPAMDLYYFEDTAAMSLAAFLAMQPRDPGRAAHFLRWVQQSQIMPLQARNAPVLDKAAELHARQLVVACTDRPPADGSRHIDQLRAYLQDLPAPLPGLLARDEDLRRLSGLQPPVIDPQACFARHRAELPARLRQAHADHRNLVPEDLAYYQAMCGLPEDYHEAPDYLARIWQPHAAQCLAADLPAALSRLLPLGVDRSTRLRQATQNLDNDTLWTALAALPSPVAAISRLNLLDLTLARAADQRFAGLAASLLAAGDDAGDAALQRSFPALFSAVYQTLRHLPVMAERPDYWLRLCAWGHGAYLFSDALQAGVDPAALAQDLATGKHHDEISLLTQVLATPRARLFLPEQWDFSAFLAARRQQVLEEHRSLLPQVAGAAEALRRLQDQAAEQDAPARIWQRDLFELGSGDEPEHSDSVPLDSAWLTSLTAGMQARTDDPLWRRLACLAPVAALPEPLLDAVRRTVATCAAPAGEQQRRAFLGDLGDLAYLACATRNRPLGGTIIDLCLDSARWYGISDSELRLYFLVGLLASATDSSPLDGYRRFNRYLLVMIKALRERTSLPRLQAMLRRLKEESSINHWAFSQAEAQLGLML